MSDFDFTAEAKGMTTQSPTTKEALERDFDHFSIVPFKAICGADRVGQSTTQDPRRAKCPICWQYWTEWEASFYFDSRVSAPIVAPVVDNLQHRLYEECVTANWDPDLRNTFAEEIAHLHEELSEAFRAWRRYKDCEVREVNGKLEGVPIEFADALIGMFYNAELYGFDLLAAVERKHQFNLNRNYVAEGRQLHAPAPASPAAPTSSDAWATWFKRLGEKASVDVVNATANLVIDERLVALSKAGVLPVPAALRDEAEN